MPLSVRLSLLAAAASLGLLTACGGSSSASPDSSARPSNPPQPSKPTVTDVYVAGTETINQIGVAKYWIGDQPVILGDGKNASAANAITVDGGKVWVAGSVMGSSASTAVLWLDAKMTVLSDPDHVPNNNAFAWGITAANGKIYTVGSSGKKAVLWTDGVPQALTDGATYASATSVAVSGGHVYVGGTVTSKSGVVIATVWKDGQALYSLGDGTLNTYVQGIALKGDDVVCAGYTALANYRTSATEWINQQGGALWMDGATNLRAFAIATSSAGNVYIGGHVDQQAIIWKQNGAQNGAAFDIHFSTQPDPSYFNLIKGLTVNTTSQGEDVYAAGTDGQSALLWKNGISKPLTDGKNPAIANAVCLYTH